MYTRRPSPINLVEHYESMTKAFWRNASICTIEGGGQETDGQIDTHTRLRTRGERARARLNGYKKDKFTYTN